MPRVRRNHDKVGDGDPLIPILNLVCMLVPLLLYGAVFVKFQTLMVKPPSTKSAALRERLDQIRRDHPGETRITLGAEDVTLTLGVV